METNFKLLSSFTVITAPRTCWSLWNLSQIVARLFRCT